MNEITSKARSLALDVYEARTERVARGEPNGPESAVLLEIHDVLVQVTSRLESLDTSVPSWEEEFETPVATRLQRLLDESNMTVPSLAQAAGLSRATISNLLEGATTNPQRKTLTKIEEVFGLEEGALHG